MNLPKTDLTNDQIDKILQRTGCTCYHESGCDKQDYIELVKRDLAHLIHQAEIVAYKKGEDNMIGLVANSHSVYIAQEMKQYQALEKDIV